MRTNRERARLLGLALLAGAAYTIRLDLPGFYDNEGRYAAVAREMVLTGDWITPHMNGSVFLNKPPLCSWLTAAAFELFGMNEWARIVPVLCAVVTLIVVGRIGARLWGAGTGLLAVWMLATTVGFALEARTLRPDCILVTSVSAALWFWLAADDAAGGRRVVWLAALYGTLGLGVLAKGAVPVILAAIPIVLVTFRTRGVAGLRALRPGLGLLVLVAVVLPWHALAAWRNPGFAWDYVVNQHLLFFLDKKFPRDSEGDPLSVFLVSFAARALPWLLLVPLAWRDIRPTAAPAPAECGGFLVWMWLLGVLGFFAVPPSRLEHYALPALPAVALLGARGAERFVAGAAERGALVYLGIVGVSLGVGGAVCLARGTALLDGVYWIGQAPQLPGLILPGGVMLVIAGLACAGAALAGRPRTVVLMFAASTLALLVLVLRAQILAGELFGWRGVADAIRTRLPATTAVVFEAPEEYQISGGLVFYLGRPIEWLEVPGFVPPTYLAGKLAGMFLPRAEFARRWEQEAPMALVTDPSRRRDVPAGIAPEPYYEVARFGDRWVLSNHPVGP